MFHIVKSLDDLEYTFQVNSKNAVVLNGYNPTLWVKKCCI